MKTYSNLNFEEILLKLLDHYNNIITLLTNEKNIFKGNNSNILRLDAIDSCNEIIRKILLLLNQLDKDK